MKEATEVFVKALQKFVAHNGNAEMKEAAYLAVREHLTNQQHLGQFVSFLVDALHDYPYRDLRNDGTKEWVSQIKASVPPGFFPLI